MTIVNLRAEAEMEAHRLARARMAIQGGGSGVPALLAPVAISYSRRQQVRRALAGRICFVWRVALEDTAGHSVESRIVATLVTPVSAARLVAVRALLQAVEDLVRTRVDADSDRWAAAAIQAAAAFTSARIAREQEISPLPAAHQTPSQAGLFDRRAWREREAQAASVAATRRTARDRAQAIAGSGGIVRRPATLLLVLVP